MNNTMNNTTDIMNEKYDTIPIPVRCFTCGKIVANKYEKYKEKVKSGISSKQVLEELGFTRYCCKRMLFTHAEIPLT